MCVHIEGLCPNHPQESVMKTHENKVSDLTEAVPEMLAMNMFGGKAALAEAVEKSKCFKLP